jgi:hypothetical protein
VQTFKIFDHTVLKITSLNFKPVADYAVYLRKHNPKTNQDYGLNGSWQSEVLTDDIDDLTVKNTVKSSIDLIYQSVPATENLKLKHLWFNINPKGSTNRIHKHSTPWVAVWYLNTGVQTGDLIFYSDKNMSEKFTFTPDPGDLLIFSGDLWHAVAENLNDKVDRIVCAMNFYTNKNIMVDLEI